MAQPLSIEDPTATYLITTRTAGSKLWFINNPELEYKILAALARYQSIYQVIIYSFILMGNHYHLEARFPNANRALFMRDFNSAVARLVGRAYDIHGRGSVWARRYSYQILPRTEDIKHWFYYVALNPVSSGLVENPKDYPSYNSYFDSIAGKNRTYKWINWSMYLMKKRYDENLKPEDCTTEYTLTFSRLPGFEELTQPEFQNRMQEELYERTKELIQSRFKEGKGFATKEKLLCQEIGSAPKHTKLSTRTSFRPLVLTLCMETKQQFLSLYFSIKELFTKASEAFRKGIYDVAFPVGTYPPPTLSAIALASS